MPEFTIKEVRMPELHLPEVKRDEIVRALSGIHVPEVDLSGIEPRRRLRSVDIKSFPWRRPAISGIDAGKAVAAAVAAARLVRPAPSRSRWRPFRKSRWAAISRSRDNLVAVVRPAPRRPRRRVAVVIIALLAATAWMLVRNPAFRARLDRTTAEARRRIDGLRGGRVDLDVDTGEPMSTTMSETTPGERPEIVATETVIDMTESAPDPA